MKELDIKVMARGLCSCITFAGGISIHRVDTKDTNIRTSRFLAPTGNVRYGRRRSCNYKTVIIRHQSRIPNNYSMNSIQETSSMYRVSTALTLL